MIAIVWKQGFQNTRMKVYTALSLAPFILSALLLFIGAGDLGRIVCISENFLLIFVVFALDWGSCSIFIFRGINNVDRATKVKATISTSISFVCSCIAVLAAGFATV